MTTVRVVALVALLSQPAAACAALAGGDPVATTPGYAPREVRGYEASAAWRADGRLLPATRFVDGVSIRVENVVPLPADQWHQGSGVGSYLPVAFRVSVVNHSDRNFEVVPSQTTLLDHQQRSWRVAGFRSADGTTSFHSNVLNPGARRSWEVGFRREQAWRRSLPTRATLVVRGSAPGGAVAEAFAFERIEW